MPAVLRSSTTGWPLQVNNRCSSASYLDQHCRKELHASLRSKKPIGTNSKKINSELPSLAVPK